MRQRQDYLMEAKDWLNRLEISIAGDIALRHQDSHIELETFFRDLLNLVYDWNLDNANTLLGQSQDSFDLSDKAASLAVQVTVTTTAEKIRTTLASFVGTYEKSYQRLIFVYPFMTLPASRADFSEALKGFDFDAGRDRLGFGSLLKEAQGFTIDKLERLIQLLRKELRPLGGELCANHSDPGSALRPTYAKWLHQTLSSFFVPGLSTQSSLDEQFGTGAKPALDFTDFDLGQGKAMPSTDLVQQMVADSQLRHCGVVDTNVVTSLIARIDALVEERRWLEIDAVAPELESHLHSLPRSGSRVRDGWILLARLETHRLFTEKQAGRDIDVSRLRELRQEADKCRWPIDSTNSKRSLRQSRLLSQNSLMDQTRRSRFLVRRRIQSECGQRLVSYCEINATNRLLT